MDETVCMHRPAGVQELALVRASGYRRWPPRLPGQTIFYPVTNHAYAAQIAHEWNLTENGYGCVAQFRVLSPFANRYPIHRVDGSLHSEWWIPAEDLAELNRSIVGLIDIVDEFGRLDGPGG